MPARLRSLDAFRGLVVVAMILVLHPGDWDAVYAPLRHATWHGWTPADSIFPFFLFIVGAGTVLGVDRGLARGASRIELTRHALRRGVALVALGLMIEGLGDRVLPPGDPLVTVAVVVTLGTALWVARRRPGTIGDATAIVLWVALGWYFVAVPGVRVPGVLQRIGVCSLLVTCACLWIPRRLQFWLTAVLIVGYWAVLALGSVPGHGAGALDDEFGNLASHVDRALLDGRLWADGLRDPEGPLSTLGALATTMLGVGAGHVLRDPATDAGRVVRLLGAGVLLVLLGGVWNWVLPINKSLWTGSFVVFTAGQASCALALCLWFVEIRGHRRMAAPAVTFGVNALIVFVGSGILPPATYTIEVAPGESLHAWLHGRWFASWLPPFAASTAYAGAWVAGYYLVLRAMQRRGIRFTV